MALNNLKKWHIKRVDMPLNKETKPTNFGFTQFCNVKKHSLYTQAIPDERFGSTQDNFGKFIHQFQPETKTLIRKLERVLIKLYR